MDSPGPGRPLVVSVLGLKDSGKTGVGEALIAELRSRGRRVAAVKSSHLEGLDRGRRGSDSERFSRAGADYVAARARGETLEWHPRRLEPAELLARVPEEIDVLLVEGGGPEFEAAAVVVCLRRAAEYAETVAVRQVPEDRVIALSGLFAGQPPPAADGLPSVPVLDSRLSRDVARLADLLLAVAANAPRTN